MKEAPDRCSVTDRAGWPVRKFKLGEDPSENLAAITTAEERLAMMWPLALDAWASLGRPLPTYERSQAPVRRFRLGESDER